MVDIKLKKSSVVGRIPDSSDLAYGELAINYADGKLFYKDASNNIKAFLDSAGVDSLITDRQGLDSGDAISIINSTVDSSYVRLRVPTNQELRTTSDVEFNKVNSVLDGAIQFTARNESGGTLTKGTVVYISGISGNTPLVDKADADDASKMPAFGIVAADANNNANVNVYTFGTLSGMDTSAFSAGDTLYVSTTAGELTSTPPTGSSSLLQNIGRVIRSDASAGSIKVGGAGRTNAVPNLDAGYIFYGNDSNRAVATDITTIIDSDYVRARQILTIDSALAEYRFMDSGEVQTLIDSDYITARAKSLEGNITITSTDDGSAAGPELILYRNSSSPADGDYIGQIQFKGRQDGPGDEIYAKVTGKISDATNGTEDGLIETAIKGNGSFTIVSRQRSDELQLLNGVGLSVAGSTTLTGALTLEGETVDSAWVQARQTTYSNVSEFTNDANYLDSTTVQGVIDASYIRARQIIGIDSALSEYRFTDSNEVFALIDSAYINARVATVDSGTITAIIDSDYILSRSSGLQILFDDSSVSHYEQVHFFAAVDPDTGELAIQHKVAVYDSNGTITYADIGVLGASGSSIDSAATIALITANSLDSSEVSALINSSYIQARQKTFIDSALSEYRFMDSDEVRTLINSYVDSAYVTARETNPGVSGAATITGTINNISSNRYTGDSSTVAYATTDVAADANDVLVTINGVVQHSNTYTVSGNTVTLDSAPESGDDIEIRVHNVFQTNVILRDYQSYVYTPSTSTTVFTGNDDNGNSLTYNSGKVEVYLNGSRLVTSLDYTETDNSTITLGSAIDSGDTLEIVSLAAAAIADPGVYPQDSDFLTTTADQVIYSWPKADYRTIKFIAQIEHDSDNKYHSEEILLSHNGSTVAMTTYAQVLLDSNLGTFDADITGSTVNLKFSPTYTNTSVKLRMIRVDA